jgi:RimJ/RimL family protein N-acetyltransferase
MHHSGQVPFFVSWPSLPPDQRARALMQRHWQRQGSWSPDDWSLGLAVFADGQVVGAQEISASDFPILRQVSSFSWLGLKYQGHGFGTEMRAAVLHLAFAGLDAAEATSGLLPITLLRSGSPRSSGTNPTASSGWPRTAVRAVRKPPERSSH